MPEHMRGLIRMAFEPEFGMCVRPHGSIHLQRMDGFEWQELANQLKNNGCTVSLFAGVLNVQGFIGVLRMVQYNQIRLISAWHSENR